MTEIVKEEEEEEVVVEDLSEACMVVICIATGPMPTAIGETIVQAPAPSDR